MDYSLMAVQSSATADSQKEQQRVGDDETADYDPERATDRLIIYHKDATAREQFECRQCGATSINLTFARRHCRNQL
jgi:hypothetical protein